MCSLLWLVFFSFGYCVLTVETALSLKFACWSNDGNYNDKPMEKQRKRVEERGRESKAFFMWL